MVCSLSTYTLSSLSFILIITQTLHWYWIIWVTKAQPVEVASIPYEAYFISDCCRNSCDESAYNSNAVPDASHCCKKRDLHTLLFKRAGTQSLDVDTQRRRDNPRHNLPGNRRPNCLRLLSCGVFSSFELEVRYFGIQVTALWRFVVCCLVVKMTERKLTQKQSLPLLWSQWWPDGWCAL